MPKLNLLTLYAKRDRGGNVTIFRDRGATDIFCQFSWDRINKPSKRNKYITLNCWQWNLNWLKD